MAIRTDRALLRQLNTIFNIGAIREWTDGQLLERFATGSGEVAELAFAALVERHGAMVLRVCRAQLADTHETEDAFQATFLILVKKARSLWVEDSLGPWLHQVAFRTASCARSSAARRRRCERQAEALTASVADREEGIGSEWTQVLHEEINRLPERYRVPIVLCDLEGHTSEEAARRLGRPVGTVKSWRARGRERLRHRLIRLGLVPSAGLDAVLAADVARAEVPQPNAEETVRAAVQVLADPMNAGEVSASVNALVKGGLKAMLLTNLRTTATTALAFIVLAAGLGAVAWVAADELKGTSDEARSEAPRPAFGPRPRPIPVPRTAQKPGDEQWFLTLREALRIGLANSEAIRVLSPVADRAYDNRDIIAPRTTGHDAQSFKAEVMAFVRSIEQQYWDLDQQRAQLWTAKMNVDFAEEVLKSAQARREFGRGNAEDMIVAQRRLEQFRLDLVAKTSDLITSDRQFRTILGLPPADNRRIVPVSPLTDEKVSPDWDKCLATMLEQQPAILQARARVREAKGRLETSADKALDRSSYLELQKKFLQQVIHQRTHTLAGFFVEIDANYKQYQTASRVRSSAAERLETQRAAFEEGQVPIDRYLDAVSQYAVAVAQEHQFKSSYNISLLALEETKGTLLEREQITVVEFPRGATSTVAERDGAAKPALHEPLAPAPALVQPQPLPPVQPEPQPLAQPETRLDTRASEAKDASPKADLAGKTFSFQMTVGIGAKPIEIRGSFTITPIRSMDAPKDQ